MSENVKQEDCNLFDDTDIVSTYTDAQAVDDGILFDLGEINAEWRRGIINMVTTNLLITKGYIKKVSRTPRITKDDVNIPNLLDLLNISAHFLAPRVMKDIELYGEPRPTYTKIKIEAPDGETFEAYAGMNQSGRFTLLLSEDY